MAERPDPPQRRYRLQIDLSAHDIADALHTLQVIVNDANFDGFPAKRVSSSGYVLEWEDRDPTMTVERYAAELEAWFDALEPIAGS